MITRQTIESTQGSPARTASYIPSHEDSSCSGWTKFSEDFSYLGPLPKVCPQGGHAALIGPDGKFQSHSHAAYIPSMNKYLAHLFFNARVNRHANILKESGDGISSEGEASDITRSQADYGDALDSDREAFPPPSAKG
jgi:hypothetical protein